MISPFLSQLMMISFNFAPRGWALANGQLLPINQNQPLFSLLGITYGGDGRVNFALPNMRGVTPVGQGNGYTLGQRGGIESTTLDLNTMPTHNHAVNAVQRVSVHGTSVNNLFAGGGSYLNASDGTQLNATILTTAGTAFPQPIDLRQPYAVINYCIALQGIFPSQT